MSTEFEEIINGLVPYFELHRIPFLIIGAKARDIIAEQFGLPPSERKTTDVDFGVLVDGWDTLEALCESFREDSFITNLSTRDNKLCFNFKGTPIDIVPFGGVEKNGKVSWPPLYDSIMTTIGYQEALKFSSEFKIGKHSVKIVAPEMLVALKIVSWEENSARQRDAEDINYIISNYEKIDPDAEEYIWDNYSELPEEFNFNMSLAAVA